MKRLPTLGVLCAAIAMAVLSATGPARADTVDLRGLRARADAAAHGHPAALRRVSDVRLPDGSKQRLDGASVAGRAQARQLVAAIDDRGRSAPVDSRDAQRQARLLLHRSAPKPPPGWFVHLGNFISGIFDALGGAGLVVVVALLLAGLVLLILVIVRSRRRVETERDDQEAPDGRGGARPRTAADWEAAARAAAAEGRYADALRYLHQAGLLRLDDAKQIHLASGRTDREYAAELGSRDQERRRRFSGLSRLVQDVVFGGAKAEADTVKVSETGWGELVHAAPAAPARSGAGDDRDAT